MNILLVEDDPKIAQSLQKGLTQAGHTLEHCADAESGLVAAESRRFDALVVDVMLPGMDGLALIETLRRRNDWTPVLVLSARQTVDDRVKGLACGGDDYLTKPFAIAELLARLDAMARRKSQGAAPAPASTMSAHGMRLDLVLRRAAFNQTELDLQPLEFALLAYLMQNEGQVVSRQQVMEKVWNYHFDPHANLVEVRISRLREKLDDVGAKPLIHTVRGAGYMFRA